MAKSRGLVAVNVEECKGCKLCVEACPVNVLHLSESFNTHGYSPAEYEGEGCTGCGVCYYACPEPGAITVFKNWQEAQQAYICQTSNKPSQLTLVDPIQGIAECEACGQQVILSNFRALSFAE
ncbi:MAG: ferredoxin family protein [Candidatus Marinimicrobia bacterium]|nr:ferredoxin family protein [Candidatus Neomarinimicrobiota bacterium]MCF7851440.1 ferredoxin family protein [Candidatus Neomarinimicrobiota bacterium]MCF7905290.1 ferredoxin family protein [Candidatus Neomarinimicrobiota bacterium]